MKAEATIQTDKEIIAKHDQGVRHRAKVELTIIHRLIKDLTKAGYSLAVNDGEEITKGNEQALVSAIFSVDEARIETRKNGELGNLEFRWSFVFLVLGNSGWDVISDYGISLESVMEPISQWIDTQLDSGNF